jgi:hypothetical protein
MVEIGNRVSLYFIPKKKLQFLRISGIDARIGGWILAEQKVDFGLILCFTSNC